MLRVSAIPVMLLGLSLAACERPVSALEPEPPVATPSIEQTCTHLLRVVAQGPFGLRDPTRRELLFDDCVAELTISDRAVPFECLIAVVDRSQIAACEGPPGIGAMAEIGQVPTVEFPAGLEPRAICEQTLELQLEYLAAEYRVQLDLGKPDRAEMMIDSCIAGEYHELLRLGPDAYRDLATCELNASTGEEWVECHRVWMNSAV
jgi:hypothetical protein